MARIALDAMGGDFAPQAPVAGALLALGELESRHTIQLFGRRAVVQAELDRQFAGELGIAHAHRERLEIVDAPDVIEMSDKPTSAMRAKPNSSMVRGLRSHAEGRSDAFVSAGNTGAQMAASMVLLKLHAGLTRPAIGALFPTSREPMILVDAGANVDCSAHELVQFARLGTVYAETLLGRPSPWVGLLNIGEEPEKGNAVTKEAYQLLREAGLRFCGNVEGRDLPRGATANNPLDVVVSDGFAGNVLLKFYEAVAPTVLGMLAETLRLDSAQIADITKTLDYTEYGGAPLLGVRGVSIICHGASSPRAIKNALRVAVRAVETDMSGHIGRRLADAERAMA